jgi:hypothetical protein
MHKNHAMKAMPQFRQLVASFPLWQPKFNPKLGHVGFVVNKVPLRQVFSENFCFLCQFLFYQLRHIP